MKPAVEVPEDTPPTDKSVWVARKRIIAWSVNRIDEMHRAICIYDNWSSLTERQAKAIAQVLNDIDRDMQVEEAS